MPGPLNIFQRTMLHWNELHPYNALHAFRVSQPLELPRLTLAINGTLESLGLTNLSLDLRRQTCHYRGGPTSSEIKLVAAGNDVQAALRAEIEAQLNRPFELRAPFNPFRFFVVPENGSFLLGAVYFHAAADGESLLHVLRRMLAVYSGAPLPPTYGPVEVHPPRQDRLLRQHAPVLARTLADLPAHIGNLRRSFRVPHRDPNEGHNGFDCFGLSPAELRGLIATAKSRGVTVNDLVLALLMKSLSPLAAGRADSRKRPHLSVGCIFNLRKDLAVDGASTFGLFLGGFLVHHQVPAAIGLPELAQAVQRQTAAIKQRRLFYSVTLDLATVLRLLPFYSTERQKKLYLKNYPLWGGITNMNVNSLWSGTAPPAAYLRTVSTGPVTPLVLGFTTARDSATVALSYRTTVFSAPMIERFKQDLRELIRSLAP